MELSALQQVTAHFLADLQTMMQYEESIILLLSVAIRGLHPPLVVLAEAELIQLNIIIVVVVVVVVVVVASQYTRDD